MRTRAYAIHSLVFPIICCLVATSFAQTPPPVSFGSAVNYAVATQPRSLAVGDFNGDGKLDLAVASEDNYNPNVSVLLGNGNGTFQAQVNYWAGASPFSVAVGDFNGDNKLDLAVANIGSNDVSVLLGNGDGTFVAAVNYSVGGSGPDFVRIAISISTGSPIW